MPNKLNLPTTVGDFCSFLDGNSVSPYGGMGKAVIDAVQKTIYAAVYRGVKLHEHGTSIPINEFRFLKHMLFAGVIYNITPASFPGLIGDVNAIFQACHQWTTTFNDSQLNVLNEEIPNVIAESQLLSLIKNLRQDCDQGRIPTQIDDIRLTNISHELLSCMRQYLTNLKDDEEYSKKLASIDGGVRGMNVHLGVDRGIILPEVWADAWDYPYHDKPLTALEAILHIYAEAIENSDETNVYKMSRIIPVVQASGTGKSRLSEEYSFFLVVLIVCRFVKRNFGVMVSLENGSGFPDRVYFFHMFRP
jgi:hypothetical protein